MWLLMLILAFSAVVLALAITRTATTIEVNYPLPCLLKQLTVVEYRTPSGDFLGFCVTLFLAHINTRFLEALRSLSNQAVQTNPG